MESSPLILAHDHARAASVATQSSDTTVAINEHALAAGEFARAAAGTGSAEALRTLRLLEQHHQRLSELLRYPSENPPATATATATTTTTTAIDSAETEVPPVSEKPLSTSAALAELRASKSDLGLAPGPSPSPRSSSPLRNPPSLSHPRRLPPRDLSSSIASNLASARGIRANYARQPLSPSVSTQQAAGGLEALPRRDGKRSKVPATIPEISQPSWVPPAVVGSKKSDSQVSAVVAEVPTASDEGFSRFYNTFESFLSKLSAPLAFAGLPLISEEGQAPPPEPIKGKQRPQSNDRSSSDPDITKYISRAALRASARDGQSGNDSFYVVPTGGGTIPYAAIVSYERKEKRRMAASIHSENADLFADPNDDDDFVDARETPMPASPSASRRSFARKLSSREVEHKVEELDTENKSLKDCIDKLSKRLHAFEMSAQQNSMALQESIRLTQNMSPARELPGRGDEGLKRRMLELEEHVSFGRREIERLGRENEKLKSVLVRYRERWETLKEGAKTRRDGTASKDAGSKGVPKKDGDPAAGRFVAG
ncbi:uncharacterized protein L3040_006287 [Drepanopeziza brunnea f. sp. 'multigermtubi']|uniref:Uncharacterized protein n=1 Tax=Marssonina brunnea f. sp. multigermtubi (strain MB_m1) TaxID=1072389 RepID=K1WUQ9_MARBU|nr:uncharacterized protein MBM_05255 [Drepanopeziza brunnea f. sp. 'multigermtubi' MB_m1]EKD16786.1 hypothetical protein MBM_05255 [Drepanopeziza brunnea f. sp. 'multigermtubi' MB_m1]KAJ5040638.1 hypothetical protein L3040_006287 [Drepanopeziza brunnea f. sp. 'multigermtubi']